MKNKFIIYVDGLEFIPSVINFPGGEVKVTIPSKEFNSVTECRIQAILTSSDDVMALVMLVDALRSIGIYKIRLTMPYVPYARQDRICSIGEAFSIRAFAKLINSLDFSSVIISDPHSHITGRYLDNVLIEPQEYIMFNDMNIRKFMGQNSEFPTYLVCPDAGAAKKIQNVADTFSGLAGIIYAEKIREMSTGKIIKTAISNPECLKDITPDSRFLIVDDIGDGFGTFVPIGEAIKKIIPTCSMSIYVTHGIFSRGEEFLHPLFDNVWCTIDFRDYK